MVAEFLKYLSFASIFQPSFTQNSTQNNKIVSILPEYTYLLPTFSGNLLQPFVNSTTTSDSAINALLKSAQIAPFISYDPDFLSIIGSNPIIKLIDQRNLDFAFEAGIWLPDRNEVWYSSSIIDASEVGGTHFEIFNLKTGKITNLTTSIPILDPNGGDYHNGLVYLTTSRSAPGTSKSNYNGGIVSVDPSTGEVITILNSYFGLQFADIDDVAWATKGTSSYMYFTQFPFIHALFPTSSAPPIANSIWRWDPQEKLLLPMVSRTDIPLPDGIRVSPDQKSLFVTDFGGRQWNSILGTAAEIGSPAIYKYDLDSEMRPVNRRLFGYPRMGGADGLHIDDSGRVWTAEGEGIIVRNDKGRVLGVFNSMYFGATHPSPIPIANFALAGNVLVILGQDRLFTVQLAETVISAKTST